MRLVSGAGHDAQMMARVCRTAMIFVPSIGGISHSPDEQTSGEDLLAGTELLLDVVLKTAVPAGGVAAARFRKSQERGAASCRKSGFG
jgi:Acetylornithine deacetylase/Succinyl-diaminopimelate desuccinylase and related deacylases